MLLSKRSYTDRFMYRRSVTRSLRDSVGGKLLPDSIAVADVISAQAEIHVQPFSDSVVARCITGDKILYYMLLSKRRIAHS